MEVNMKKKQINIKYYIANIRIGKKSRDITLYKIEDKNKQRQLYQKYEPLFLTQIDDAVYSYRKRRSNWTAIQKITPLLSQYKYYLVCDIKDFFPSINRKVLTQQLNKFIPNNDVKIIMKYVTCCKTGISEGSPLSPMLSNLALKDFDKFIQKQYNHDVYLRYGDDILILSNKNPSSIKYHIEKSLWELGFKVNYDKIHYGIIEKGFCYLGFFINYKEVKIRTEKVTNILEKLKKENNKEKRKQIWQGFQSYYRNSNYLPINYQTLSLLCYVKDTKNISKLFLQNRKTLTLEEKSKIQQYCIKNREYVLLLHLKYNSLRKKIYENSIYI